MNSTNLNSTQLNSTQISRACPFLRVAKHPGGWLDSPQQGCWKKNWVFWVQIPGVKFRLPHRYVEFQIKDKSSCGNAALYFFSALMVWFRLKWLKCISVLKIKIRIFLAYCIVLYCICWHRRRLNSVDQRSLFKKLVNVFFFFVAWCLF